MDGYKRFADYAWSSQNRLRRPRLEHDQAENEDVVECAGVARAPDNSHNDDIHEEDVQRPQTSEESGSDSDIERGSDDCPAGNPQHRETSSEESNCENTESEHDDESTEEDVGEDLSDNNFECENSDNDDVDNELGDRLGVPQEGNNEPLYDGAPLTTAESSTAILNMSLRHNVTDELFSDILRLVELHCPPDNKCKKTPYKFMKSFGECQTPLVRHFFCAMCLQTVDRQDSICPDCGDAGTITYFIEGPVISQLKSLFKRPGFQELLQHRQTRNRERPNTYEDIYDGAVYKELCGENGLLNDPANISFTWYTDGIRIYNTSKFHIWPMYLVINELPVAVRTKKENVILAGLWFGDGKPVSNLFLGPLQEAMEQLREGIDVEVPNAENTINVKGIIICCTCDLPAKALFYNMIQYNGKFGCQKCKQQGVYLRREKVQIWPHEPFNLRTDRETAEHARQAFETGRPVCGVKGPSMLLATVHESMRAIAVDVMHCVDEGIGKNLLNFWFSPSFSDHPSSLAAYVHLVEERLKSLTPPSFVQRGPRSIREHLPYWRANEVKAWLLYYSIPCVNDIMENLYLEHHKLLVQGISLLYQSSISQEEVEIASRALEEYVCRFEELYGRRYLTNNLHQLRHLAECVRQFGPLWTTSCYRFEDLNGRIKSMVHGSNSAQLQIYDTLSAFLNLTTLKAETLVEGRPAHSFCESLESSHGRMKRYIVSDTVSIIGKCTKMQQLSPDLEQVLEEVNDQGLTRYYYQRLLQKNVLYSCTDYRRHKLRNSTFAMYSVDGNSMRIGKVQCFIRTTDCLCPSLCGCDARNYAILQPCILQNEFATCIDNTTLSSIHTLLDYENKRAIDITCLKSVCFYCHIRDTLVSYIIEPVNRVEWE